MKVFGLSKVVWQILFLVSQFLAMILMIITIFDGYWFDQKWDGYIRGKFQGALLGPDCDIYGVCSSGDTYNDCGDNSSGDLSDMFDNWNNAGVRYLYIEIVGIIFLATGGVMVAVGFCTQRCCGGCCTLFNSAFYFFIGAFAHFIAFVVWAGSVKLQISSCTHSVPYSGVKSVCIQSGASLALGILFFLFPVAVIYFLIARKLKNIEQSSDGRILERFN